jgi:hypothetical protein
MSRERPIKNNEYRYLWRVLWWRFLLKQSVKIGEGALISDQSTVIAEDALKKW